MGISRVRPDDGSAREACTFRNAELEYTGFGLSFCLEPSKDSHILVGGVGGKDVSDGFETELEFGI